MNIQPTRFCTSDIDGIRERFSAISAGRTVKISHSDSQGVSVDGSHPIKHQEEIAYWFWTEQETLESLLTKIAILHENGLEVPPCPLGDEQFKLRYGPIFAGLKEISMARMPTTQRFLLGCVKGQAKLFIDHPATPAGLQAPFGVNSSASRSAFEGTGLFDRTASEKIQRLAKRYIQSLRKRSLSNAFLLSRTP